MACENITDGWSFQILNGNTGEMSISDPLIDSESIAEERAMSEFLKNAYAVHDISFSTYRTDLALNDVVNIASIPYLIKGISTSIDGTSMVSTIRARRYV